MTSIGQKGLAQDPTAPDFWVLFQIRPGADGQYGERFFVLTHAEICAIQAARNKRYAANYRTKHGKEPDLSAGVDNVGVSDVEQHENQWSKIIERFGRGS